MNTPKQIIETARKQGAKMVDVKFVDTFGTWQHFSCPIAELTAFIETPAFHATAGQQSAGVTAPQRHVGNGRPQYLRGPIAESPRRREGLLLADRDRLGGRGDGDGL